jgi:DNA-binding PadR family transcriptional regulator
VLELAILGLLKDRPMHGYDLRKCLRETFGVFSHVSFGSLYPALARLEANGAVRSLSSETDSESPVVPLTGSLGGERAATIARRATAKAALALGSHGTRARKVYEITDAGQQLFERQLAVPDVADGDARGFSVRVALARHLSPAARRRLFEQRRAELVDLQSRARRSYAERERDLDSYGRSLADHLVQSLDLELAWVDELLHNEVDDDVARTPSRQPVIRNTPRRSTVLSGAISKEGNS